MRMHLMYEETGLCSVTSALINELEFEAVKCIKVQTMQTGHIT